MKLKKSIVRIIGPMGLMGPIGLIGLMGPIGLIGPIGLMGCSSGQEEPEQELQEAGQGPAIGFAASFAGEGSSAARSRAAVSAARSRAAGSAARSRAAGTRAVGDGELTTNLLKEQGFGVYCWYTEAADFTTPSAAKYMLMRNQKVEWKAWDGPENPETWNYTPSKYWPLNSSHKLTFRAYAPYANYVFETSDPAAPATYIAGMPLLPVVVAGDDYANGTQHDPLWGTGYPLITHDDDHPYMPDDKTYGTLYNNVTYTMSGDTEEADPHDGTIHWFFHHGMAKLLFTCTVTDGPGCDKVTIKGISLGNLYDKGLLDISSPAAASTDKPYWYDCGGNIKAEIGATSLITRDDPLVILTTDVTSNVEELTRQLIYPGLLIIPRSYTEGDKLKITVTYTIDDETEPQEATAEIVQTFWGNTVYTLKLLLEPATKGLEITLVQSAFTPWTPAGTGSHEVYNW